MIVNRALALAGWLAERTLMNTRSKTDKTVNANQNCANIEDGATLTELMAKARAFKAQAEHSPLPWHYIDDNPDEFTILARVPDTSRYATTEGPQYLRDYVASVNDEANARLIVASVNHAEALAEALRDLRTRVVATGPNCLKTTKADEALANWEGAK